MPFDPGWIPYLLPGGAASIYVGQTLKRVLGPSFDALGRRLAAPIKGAAELAEEKRKLLNEAKLAEFEQTLRRAEPEGSLAAVSSPPQLVLVEDQSLLVPHSTPSERAAAYDADERAHGQTNVEAVVLRMLKSPPPDHNKTSDGKRTPGEFFATWRRGAENADDDEVRERYAKLLAGEIVNPGSFSVRTLDAVRLLATEDVALFERLCPFVAEGGAIILDAFEATSGITYAELMHLESLGLLQRNFTLTMPPDPQRPNTLYALAFSDKAVVWRNDAPTALVVNAHFLTRTAKEIHGLNRHHAPMNYLNSVREIVDGQRKRDVVIVDWPLPDQPEGGDSKAELEAGKDPLNL